MKSNVALPLANHEKLDLKKGLEEVFFGAVNRFVYIAGHSKSSRTAFYTIYKVFAKLMITFFVSCELWYMFTKCDTWFDVVECINGIVINFMAFYRYINMLNHKEVFKELSKSMELPYFDVTTSKRQALMQYWIKTNRDYTKLLLALGHFTLFVWYIYPLIDDIEYNLCINIRLPFFYHSPVMYPLAYLLVMVSFQYTAWFVMTNDLIMQTHFIHHICQYTILGDCFENIISDCLPDNETKESLENNGRFTDVNVSFRCVKRLDNLIEQHKTLLKHTEQLKTVLSAPMTMQVMISSIQICFAGYQVTQAAHAGVAKLMMSLLYLGYNMFELLIFCRWSDEIKEQSQSIQNAAYFSGWEHGLALIPGIRARLMLIIARAAKSEGLTAGGIYELSLQSYGSLVKTSYSALNLLLQLEKGE